MTAQVAVVLPAHARPGAMRLAAQSVLAQTHADLELLLVLDGAHDPVRTAAAELAASDMRVRVLDLPESPGPGFEHVQRAIESSTAPVVAYAADTDLWLPHHLETLLGALPADGPGLAHSLPVYVGQDGRLRVPACDLALDWFGAPDLLGRVTPTHVAHTRAALDGTGGWALPEDAPGPVALWQQMLASQEVARRSVQLPTALVFPADERPGWDAERHRAELASWAERLAQPGAGSALTAEVLAAASAQRAEEEAAVGAAFAALSAEWDALERERDRLAGERDALQAQAGAAQAEHEAERERLAREAESATAAQAELEARLAEREERLAALERQVAARWPARARRAVRRLLRRG